MTPLSDLNSNDKNQTLQFKVWRDSTAGRVACFVHGQPVWSLAPYIDPEIHQDWSLFAEPGFSLGTAGYGPNIQTKPNK